MIHVSIQKRNFSADRQLVKLRAGKNGALASFIGIVREENDLLAIEYESYVEMAVKDLMELSEQAINKFKINDVSIIHRIGVIVPGENVIFIGVGAAHREEAFKSTRWLLSQLKKKVPIWKKIINENGGMWV